MLAIFGLLDQVLVVVCEDATQLYQPACKQCEQSGHKRKNMMVQEIWSYDICATLSPSPKNLALRARPSGCTYRSPP